MHTTTALPDSAITCIIRACTPDDIQSVNRIWNQGIVDRIATLDTTAHTIQQTTQYYNTHNTELYCIYVAVYDNTVVGFYSISPYSHRVCYAHITSLTIYVDRSYRAHHIGTQLLLHAHHHCMTHNIKKIILSALSRNHVAMKWYERHGYRTVGSHIKQGIIDGQWCDTVIMEKLFGEQK